VIHVWVKTFERIDDGTVDVLMRLAKDGVAVSDPQNKLTRKEVLKKLAIKDDL
jgi:hypothetical protein